MGWVIAMFVVLMVNNLIWLAINMLEEKKLRKTIEEQSVKIEFFKNVYSEASFFLEKHIPKKFRMYPLGVMGYYFDLNLTLKNMREDLKEQIKLKKLHEDWEKAVKLCKKKKIKIKKVPKKSGMFDPEPFLNRDEK
jgi:hypothetical protein